MTTIIKDNGIYKVKQGDTLNAIAASQGRSLASLIANNPQFASNPNMIQPGETVNYGNLTPQKNLVSTGPNYSDLNSTVTDLNLNNGVGEGNTFNFSSKNSIKSNPTSSFTEMLIKMLKDSQAGLMKQKQDITGLGLNSANNRDYSGVNPNDIVGLRRGAISAVNPGELSLENQMKLMNEFGDRTLTSYEKSQDRELREREFQANQNDPYKNYSAKNAVSQVAAQKKIAGLMENSPRDASGYVTPEAYRNLKQAWVADGFAGNDFDAIFNGQINPANPKDYGVGFQTKVSSNSTDLASQIEAAFPNE